MKYKTKDTAMMYQINFFLLKCALKRKRINLKLSGRDLAKKVNRSHSYISRIENVAYLNLPSDKTLYEICEVLELTDKYSLLHQWLLMAKDYVKKNATKGILTTTDKVELHTLM